MVGGRKYGSDEKAVTDECERLNLKSMEWEMIPSLNFPRCTSMGYTHKGQIFIAGGYSPGGKRLESIEVFCTKNHTWFCLGTFNCP